VNEQTTSMFPHCLLVYTLIADDIINKQALYLDDVLSIDCSTNYEYMIKVIHLYYKIIIALSGVCQLRYRNSVENLPHDLKKEQS